MIEATPALCTSEHCRPLNHGGPRQTMRGSTLCEVCEQQAWDDLQTVVRLWPSTVHALLGTSGGNNEPVSGTPSYGLDLDDKAIERRAEVIHDLRYWVHLLLDEGRVTRAPSSENVPAMAKVVATHIRHLTHHHDQGVAESIRTDARSAARAARHLSAPQRSRRYRPGIPCVEHDVDDMGQRVPCQGEYVARLGEQMTGLPDLVCTVDATHVLTPSGFRRLGRATSREGASRLLDAITGAAS